MVYEQKWRNSDTPVQAKCAQPERAGTGPKKATRRAVFRLDPARYRPALPAPAGARGRVRSCAATVPAAFLFGSHLTAGLCQHPEFACTALTAVPKSRRARWALIRKLAANLETGVSRFALIKPLEVARFA
jgi:hypothetical protein